MSLSTSLLWRGLLAVMVGIVSVTWPDITVGAVVLLFAGYAFIAAASDTVRAFRSSGAGSVAGYLLLAGISLIAGVVALLWPGITALALVVWMASWAVVTGIVEIVLAFRQGEAAGERAMWAITGLISVALGVVLFLRPGLGALSLATVFGLFSIVYGVAAVVLSLQARKAVHRLIGTPA